MNNLYLAKYLAQCGVCSRRKAVELVKSGQIQVNGEVVKDVTYLVQPGDRVKYNDFGVKFQDFKYIMLNKPKNFITSLSDEKGRPTVLDLIGDKKLGRVYPVGRLDYSTTGILLLTNDGQLAQKLSHPKYEVSKGYLVTLDRPLHKDDLERISKGIRLYDGFIKVDHISYASKVSPNKIIIQLHSGKNRIVRRIFEYFSYRIKKLDRFSYAGLTAKGLPLGKWRFLTKNEVEKLNKI